MRQKIPLAAMDRILRESGITRVSDSAKEALCEILEEIVEDTTKRSAQIARHANRSTILKDDILLGIKKN